MDNRTGGGDPVESTFRADVAEVAAARHFTATAIAGWGVETLEWTAALVVTELATNAVIHAGTAFRVELVYVGDQRLRVVVTDGSPRRPRQRSYGTEATTGRGLALVASLSRAWGVTATTAGKAVWCELAADDNEEAEPDLDAFLDMVDLTEAGTDAIRTGGGGRSEPSATGRLRRAAA